MSKELVKVDYREFELEETKAKEIQAMFQPMLDKMVELETEFNQITKRDVDIETCLAAKVLRNKYVKIRTGTAEIHKELKSFYLRGGRFVDGWKNAQLMASEGIETKLKGIENHFENIEKERIAKLQEKRLAELQKYEPEMIISELGKMADDVWDNYITGVKLNYNAGIEAYKKTEEDRLKKIEEEKAEQERIRKENKQLKKDAEKKEKLRLIEEKDRKAKEEAERKIREEKERKERAEYEAKLKKEREEKERLMKIESNRKAKEEADRLAKEEAERQNNLAPDKEKLLALASEIGNYELPKVNSAGANKIINTVATMFCKVELFINEKCEKL